MLVARSPRLAEAPTSPDVSEAMGHSQGLDTGHGSGEIRRDMGENPNNGAAAISLSKGPALRGV